MANPEKSLSRNSDIRLRIAPIVEPGARFINEHLSFITPDHVTAFTIAAVALISAYAGTRKQPLTWAESFAIGGALFVQLLDLTDGALKREKDRTLMEKNIVPEEPKNDFGPEKDAIADAGEELFVGLAQAKLAHDRGDKIGEFTAYVGAVSNGVPRLFKAWAESRGKVVDENGEGNIGKLGSRTPRALINGAALSLPRAQKYFNLISITANMRTAIGRAGVVIDQDPKSVVLSGDDKKKSNRRFKALAGTQAGVVLATLGTAYLLHRKK